MSKAGEGHRRCASLWVPWAHIWWVRVVMALGALYWEICSVAHNLMSLKGSWNHVWIWGVTPPLADERDNLEPSPGPFSTRAVYLQSRGCFSLPKAAAKLAVKTWLCTSSVRMLSLLWYMSHFIPYNSCTSPTLGLRGLELSITLVIIFMTGLQWLFSSDCPVLAQGRGLLLKGYRCDRWECVKCSLDTDRMSVCVSHLLSPF